MGQAEFLGVVLTPMQIEAMRRVARGKVQMDAVRTRINDVHPVSIGHLRRKRLIEFAFTDDHTQTARFTELGERIFKLIGGADDEQQ